MDVIGLSQGVWR